MSVTSPFGPAVENHEDRFRCLMYAKWWDEGKNCVSSAGISLPGFSVDVAFIAGSEEETLKRFLAGTGLVVFNCGESREMGCHPRLEADERCPENKAQAHVYMPHAAGQRKRA